MPTYLYPGENVYPGESVFPSVPPQDLTAVHAQAVAERRERRLRRIRPPLIRLWDGDWVLRGVVRNEIRSEWQLLDNETGIGVLEIPMYTPKGEKYYLAEWAMDPDRDPYGIHVTVDKDGLRWGGRMEEVDTIFTDQGTASVKITFKHDLEELKHIRCWPNPFLPAEIQFPRLWFMFGPAKWAVKLTLAVNIMRLESSLWMLPDDPLDPSQWFNFDISTWSMVVAPGAIDEDNSPFAIPFSRMKSAYDMSKRIMQDGQLSWVARRYLDGDPPPWPGANLRHGCLVWDIVDKSGWTTGTSFGGNLLTGLVRAFTTIESDGLTEGVDIINDPSFPVEYTQPGWMGTLPEAPWVILRHGIGVQSSSFKQRPATDVQVTTGGHSMPGVNELISAAIQCVAGETIIDGPDGKERIDALAARGTPFRVWALTPNGERVGATADFAFKKGRTELFEYTLANGQTITATTRHRWLTRAGWAEAGATAIGTEVAAVSPATAVDIAPPNDDLPDAAWIGVPDGGAVEYSPVVSARSVGVQDFYDMHVPGWVTYSGNGVWSHNTAGDLIAAAVFIPPIGGTLDAILKPLYTDVLLAFMSWKSPERAQRLGWSHYHEKWGDGADRAYSLAALIALRTGFWLTREQTSHSVVVADGAPYLVGARGFGHMDIGDRVGTTVKGMPAGRVFVDRITELTLAASRDEAPAWKIQVGEREFEDPVLKALEVLQDVLSIAQDLGVL
ncbi:hypothetical protein [Nocardia vulneris]|uniref:Gp37-like protein n=1 Tax=Nocardia vulneris TaxID=1141657 RepID=UPI0006900728|nr:hypothetical protein [Nocardia vulneris]